MKLVRVRVTIKRLLLFISWAALLSFIYMAGSLSRQDILNPLRKLASHADVIFSCHAILPSVVGQKRVMNP